MRPPRIVPPRQAVFERFAAFANTDPTPEAAHWTAGAMASPVGVSISFVQRIWRAHQLQRGIDMTKKLVL